MEWVFIVITAHADRAQFFEKGFAVPKLSDHKTIRPMLLLVLVIVSKSARARARITDSQDDLQSIARDFNAGLLEFCAFRRARHQNRVGIVDMSVNFPTGWRSAQEIKAAVIDGQMIDLPCAAAARPHSCEFVVTPKCAVE